MSIQHTLRNLAFITVGAFMIALGVVIFFSPNHIATGGPPGVAIIVYHLFDIRIGLTVLAVNVVLMLIGGRLLGPGYLIRTCYAFLASSAFIELLYWLMPNPAVTAEPLLNTLYGGILLGIGLALNFKGEAASGGWTLVARIVAGYLKIGVGQVIQFFDFTVIIVSGLVFHNIEAALWAGIGAYVTGIVIDMVLTGRADSKVVHVSTSAAEMLTELLPERLRESGSVIHCNTVRDVAGHDLMLLVVDNSQVAHLNEVIREVDADAHVVVMDAVEFFTGAPAR